VLFSLWEYDVKYISKDKWNPYWRAKTGLEVTPQPPREFFLAKDRKRPLYECIRVYSYCEQDPLLNEEGDPDNESDELEFETEMMRKKSRYRESVGSDVRGVTVDMGVGGFLDDLIILSI